MKTDPSRKKYDVRKIFFFYLSQYLGLQLSFFVSANIILVGQRCLTIKEFERSRQNQAITLALSASRNTIADIIPVCAEGGAEAIILI